MECVPAVASFFNALIDHIVTVFSQDETTKFGSGQCEVEHHIRDRLWEQQFSRAMPRSNVA